MSSTCDIHARPVRRNSGESDSRPVGIESILAALLLTTTSRRQFGGTTIRSTPPITRTSISIPVGAGLTRRKSSSTRPAITKMVPPINGCERIRSLRSPRMVATSISSRSSSERSLTINLAKNKAAPRVASRAIRVLRSTVCTQGRWGVTVSYRSFHRNRVDWPRPRLIGRK